MLQEVGCIHCDLALFGCSNPTCSAPRFRLSASYERWGLILVAFVWTRRPTKRWLQERQLLDTLVFSHVR